MFIWAVIYFSALILLIKGGKEVTDRYKKSHSVPLKLVSPKFIRFLDLNFNWWEMSKDKARKRVENGR